MNNRSAYSLSTVLYYFSVPWFNIASGVTIVKTEGTLGDSLLQFWAWDLLFQIKSERKGICSLVVPGAWALK